MIKKSPTASLVIILLVLISGAITPIGFQAKETREMAQSNVAIVSAASFDTFNIAPGSIVAAFGQKLATTTAVATDADPNRPGVQLPTFLGGVRIRVQGQDAGLIFVSPGQINFVVPENLDLSDTSNPPPSGIPVEIIPSDGPILTTNIFVSPVSPAIFTADSSGGGLPAATVLRVKADGTQVSESLYQRDASGAIIPKPIDLGPESERVFLILFLTGIGHATGPKIPDDVPAGVSVRVIANGYSLKPAFVGRQGDFAGVDQINVELPRGLLGDSTLKIAVTAIDEKLSNQTEVPLAFPQASFLSWAPRGLPDKRINSLGANGDTIVAGAPMEIFRSTDRGARWTLSAWGFPTIRPTALAFATTVGGQIYAATERHGMYFSGDDGQGWIDTARPGDNLLSNQRVFSLATNSKFAFAGSDGLGVLRRDVVPCCSHWGPVNVGLTAMKITALATRGDLVVAGTPGNGVFVSANNAGGWTAMNQGLPANAEVNALAIGDNGVFAGLSNGIYRSTDGGANWSQLTGGLPANPNITALQALGPNVFAAIKGAGVYMSTDGGGAWRAINQGLTNPEVLSLLVNKNNLFAGTTTGVFATSIILPYIQPPVAQPINVKTNEDTPVMVNLQTGAVFGGPPQYEITFEPRNGSLIISGSNVTYIPNENYNGVDTFVYRTFSNNIGSRPATVTVEIAPAPDPPKVSVRGDLVLIAGQIARFQVDATDPDTLQRPTLTANNLPADARFDPDFGQLIWVPSAAGSFTFSFTATDDGNPPLSDTQTVTVRVADNPEKAAWSQIGAPDNLPVSALFADGSDIYAAATQLGINPDRLFKSVDQGASWTPADNGLIGPVQSIQRSGAALFAITNTNVYRSTNNGANWTAANGDLPRRDNGALSVTALKATSDRVFVATSTGIFATTDQGAHWANVTGDLPFLPTPSGPIPGLQPRIVSLEISGDAIFAVIAGDLIFFSGSGAVESQPEPKLNLNLNLGVPVEQAEELASDTPRYGVFRTTNNGVNWVAVNNGLPPGTAQQFFLNVRRVIASGTRLYALSYFQLYSSNDLGAKWTPIANNLPGAPSGAFLIAGPVRSFVILRDNFYLALPILGLYSSRNNGADWLPINIGLGDSSLLGFEISGSRLFAVTSAGKLYVRSAM